jgi:hypothetical protein
MTGDYISFASYWISGNHIFTHLNELLTRILRLAVTLRACFLQIAVQGKLGYLELFAQYYAGLTDLENAFLVQIIECADFFFLAHQGQGTPNTFLNLLDVEKQYVVDVFYTYVHVGRANHIGARLLYQRLKGIFSKDKVGYFQIHAKGTNNFIVRIAYQCSAGLEDFSFLIVVEKNQTLLVWLYVFARVKNHASTRRIAQASPAQLAVDDMNNGMIVALPEIVYDYLTALAQELL